MHRRAFLGALANGLLAAPLAVQAQQAGKVYRIGLLDYSAPDPARQAWWNAFRQQMRQLGYVEGQNVTFEPRWGQSDYDHLLPRGDRRAVDRLDDVSERNPGASEHGEPESLVRKTEQIHPEVSLPTR